MPVTFISYVIPHSYNEYTVLKFATGHIALKSSEECRPFKIFFLANCLGGAKLWKNLSFFVALPAVGLCMVNAYLKHQEEHHHTRAEFIPYEHLRIRNKRFPWGEGKRSLFHNPHTNPLPDGYED